MTMQLALIFLPIGLGTLGFVIALPVDALVHDRASRARAAVRRETVPMLPWPYPEGAERDQVRRVLVRDERGHADDSFLRKLTMVCFVVLVLSGLIVYWIGDGTPDQTNDHRPRIGHQPSDGHKPRSARELAAQPEGGAGCGQGA